jgi:glucose dehydrogenase
MTTFAIYAYLFAATTLYAVVLSRFKHFWEPDLTWLEVVIGVAICLIAPYVDQRQNGPLTSELYEWRVWQCFLVGGLPIVLWRVGASVQAWVKIGRRIFPKDDNGNTTDRATSVAEQRRAESETDD